MFILLTSKTGRHIFSVGRAVFAFVVHQAHSPRHNAVGVELVLYYLFVEIKNRPKMPRAMTPMTLSLAACRSKMGSGGSSFTGTALKR
jgi:hypothetical protein